MGLRRRNVAQPTLQTPHTHQRLLPRRIELDQKIHIGILGILTARRRPKDANVHQPCSLQFRSIFPQPRDHELLIHREILAHPQPTLNIALDPVPGPPHLPRWAPPGREVMRLCRRHSKLNPRRAAFTQLRLEDLGVELTDSSTSLLKGWGIDFSGSFAAFRK
jgi:hypothetical protein